ncbi:Pantoate--beta-alanine ligase [Planctomycetales bacterium 10988]|nr:Pantoate--beta-alanine ligase [Planctomycetales bacterium 10988]
MNTSSSPVVISTIAELRSFLAKARSEGKQIGLVPTMGALHKGHLSLVEACREECDLSVVSIFVNPTQFAPGEDFEKYPRTLDSDREKLATVEADVIFAPSTEEVYPPGSSTTVHVAGLTERWEGATRPTHFDGVTTVVMKLFQMVQPDRAYFGQKDFQQAQILLKMVRDLNLPLQMRICPIVREADGLAMSSRNAYLSTEERRASLVLYKSLQLAERFLAEGILDADRIRLAMEAEFSSEPLAKLDYVALLEAETLNEVDEIQSPVIALVAAWVGKTRLIDNLWLRPAPTTS